MIMSSSIASELQPVQSDYHFERRAAERLFLTVNALSSLTFFAGKDISRIIPTPATMKYACRFRQRGRSA